MTSIENLDKPARITTTLPADLYKRLQKLSGEDDITLSEAFRRLVSQSLFFESLNESGIEAAELFGENPRVVRSIEFPAGYREAGTSILTYFNHILKVKYPDTKVKVTIQQDDLSLKMIILTPDGKKEEIEKTLEEYGQVVTGKLPIDVFLEDPFEVIALKSKLEISRLELRQAKDLHDLELRQAKIIHNMAQNKDNRRIDSLETHLSQLYGIIEKSLKSGESVAKAIEGIAGQENKHYDLRGAKFGGGFATEGSHQKCGEFNDYSVQVSNNMSEIKQLMRTLHSTAQTFPEEQKIDIELEIDEMGSSLADEQKREPKRLGKHVRALWMVACATAVGIAGVTDFSNNVLDLSKKLGVPIPIELRQQNPHLSFGNEQ